jgi:hypothetical protein
VVAKLIKKLPALFRTQEFINFIFENGATGICSDPVLNISISSGSTVLPALITIYLITLIIYGLSQGPRSLRRESAAARLLELWVRIPRRHGCLSVVIVVCCQVEVSALVSSLVQRSPTECSVSECDNESSIMRRPWPIRDVAPW